LDLLPYCYELTYYKGVGDMRRGIYVNSYIYECKDCHKDYDLKIAEERARKSRERIVRCPHCNLRKGTI